MIRKKIGKFFLTPVFCVNANVAERIQAVGIQGIGDVKQLALHTLDFNANMKFNAHWSVKFSAKNLLNTDVVFRQEIPSKNTEVEVERFNEGVGLSFGVTYTL